MDNSNNKLTLESQTRIGWVDIQCMFLCVTGNNVLVNLEKRYSNYGKNQKQKDQQIGRYTDFEI